jgi:hypothetical protein
VVLLLNNFLRGCILSFFPDVIPSIEKCFADVASGILEESGLIFLDASILIHCYEMNPQARDELLDAFEQWGARVFVPTWAAAEVWEYIRSRIAPMPLQSPAARTKKELARFKREAVRYVDDATIDGLNKEEFEQQLAGAIDGVLAMIGKVENHQPRSDQTTARLLPFIESRRLGSDLNAIFASLSSTGNMRLGHRVPPGFGDFSPERDIDDETEASTSPKGRGKQKNSFGDVIIWLEILDTCKTQEATQLVLLTKDTTKGDWAYAPKKVRDADGRPQNNEGQITLPLPLLMHEATVAASSLTGVHVVSVEMLAQVLQKNLKMSVPNLARALQAHDDDNNPARQAATPAEALDDDAVPQLSSTDMVYHYPYGDAVDDAIRALHDEGWKAQNAAARSLDLLLPQAQPDQRLQIGRALVAAALDNAVQPIEFLQRALATNQLAKRSLLVGVLAQLYIAESGEPKRPQSPEMLTDLIFEYESLDELQGAYKAVLDRLRPARRKYLALPGDHAVPVHVELALNGTVLRGASVGGVPVLEELAHTRPVLRAVGDAASTAGEILAEIAREFVVPLKLLTVDRPTNFEITVPKHVGFVDWGPTTGTLLR